MKFEGNESGHLRYSLWADIKGVGLRKCWFFKSHTCFAIFNMDPGGEKRTAITLPSEVRYAQPGEVRDIIEGAARQHFEKWGWV